MKLNKLQLKYLDVFSRYKAFARRDELSRALGADLEAVESSLFELKLLKRNKRGALLGPSYETCLDLIRQNTETVESIEASIESYRKRIREIEDKIRSERIRDPYFCLVEREFLDSIRYAQDQIRSLNKTLETLKSKAV